MKPNLHGLRLVVVASALLGLAAFHADALAGSSPFPPARDAVPLRLALALESRSKVAAPPPANHLSPVVKTGLPPVEQLPEVYSLAAARASSVTPEAAATWEIAPSDGTLNATLSRWAASAGWQLVWELDIDYAINTRTVLQGSFDEAVGRVAQSLEGAAVPMQAIFYAGNRVLRVVAKGGE